VRPNANALSHSFPSAFARHWASKALKPQVGARELEVQLSAAAATVFCTAFTLVATPAHSAGFAILEQSAGRLGGAFSGTAAIADDPSALYFNPASLLYLDGNQAAAALSTIAIDSQFSNRNSVAALGQPLGDAGGNAGGLNWVPSAYLTSRLGERIGVGVGINAPFGLTLKFDDGWLGRFQARRSEIKTLNINPAVAWQLHPMVTVALGANYQRLEAELSSAVNYSAVIAQGLQQLVAAGTLTSSQALALTTANAGLQGHTSVRGQDWDWGFNAGAVLQVNADVRIGLAYRSPIIFDVGGNVQFDAPATPEPIGTGIVAAVSAANGSLAPGPARVDLKVPASATASYWQQLGSHWVVLADVAWTQWSSIQELRVRRASGATLSVVPENWDDTWRAAIGAEWQIVAAWKLRGGIAYDQTPVPDSTRTPRLPDADRFWLAAGASWMPVHSTTVDVGYARLFADDVPVHQDAGNPAAFGLIRGTQSNAVDIFATQVAVKF
jgi:long-chain fatty acid transport protein